MVTESRGHDGGRQDELKLWAEMEIQPPSRLHCPLIEYENVAVEHLEHVISDGVCMLEVDTGDGGNSTYSTHLESEMNEHCLCTVFLAHGCIPRIIETNGSDGIVGTALPDRDTLRDIVYDINQSGGSVKLTELTQAVPDDDTDDSWVDLSSLTEKERTTVQLATNLGYYERPRKATLNEIANHFDVTKQSISYLLNSAEGKIVTAIFDSR